MLIGSTNSFTPCDSNTWSPAPCPFSSIIKPYWKPEQPPPCTNTRRPLPDLFSSTSSSLIFDAAVSDTLIMILHSPSESLSLYQQGCYELTCSAPSICPSSPPPGQAPASCTRFQRDAGTSS